MKLFKNKVLLIIILLSTIIVGISIYAYAHKSLYGDINNKSNINNNENSSNKLDSNKASESTEVKENTLEEEPEIIEKTKYKVKGVYITGWTAGSKIKINHFIDLINKTELNTLVIDIKDDEGRISYKSELPLSKEIGSSYNMINDINALMSKLKDNNVHTIARIVAFKDPILAIKKPNLALKTTSGSIWRDRKNTAWLNPYNKDSWTYSIDLAKEAVKLGFDEIQFDYVRFPTDGRVKSIDYQTASKGIAKSTAINEFLAKATQELSELGVPVSADIYGIVTTNIGDIENIGQDLETINQNVDYISPMVYPSHYALGQYGISKPDFEPYNIVYKSLSTAKARLDNIPENEAIIRPYLQDFTASWIGKGNYKKYTAQDVKAQIKATYDSGLDEWILWNASNKYHEDALLAE